MLKQLMNGQSKAMAALAVPALLFIGNFILKVIHLDSQSIAGDEPFSIYVAGMPPREIVRYLATGNNPPLWELLLSVWVKWFGTDAFSVRFMPLIFSSVTAVLLYLIGRRYFSVQVGLVAALLFTFSEYHIHFSHEARAYALFSMLTCLSMYLFMRMMEGQGRNGLLFALLSLSNGVLIYTHFFGLWVIFVQVALLMLHSLPDKRITAPVKWGMAALLLTGLFYLPYVPTLIERFTESASKGTWIQPPNGLYGLLDMLRTFLNEEFGSVNFYGGRPYLTVLLVGGAMLGHARQLLQRGPHTRSMAYAAVYVWFLLPFLFMWAVSFKVPMFHDRYLAFVSVGFILFLAIGLNGIFTLPWMRTAVMAGAVLLMLLTCDINVSNKRDMRGAVSRIAEMKQLYPDAPVIICPDWYDLHFAYYWDRECFERPATADEVKLDVAACLHGSRVWNVSSLHAVDTALMRSVGHVIFLDAGADFSYPSNNILPDLKRMFTRCDHYHYPEIFHVYHCHME